MKKSRNTSLLFIVLAYTLHNDYEIQASTNSSSPDINLNARDHFTPVSLITTPDDDSNAQIISNGIKRSFSSISETPTETYTIPTAIRVRRLLDEIKQDENDSHEQLQEKIHKKLKILKDYEEALHKEAAEQELLAQQKLLSRKHNKISFPKNTLLNMR